MKFSIIIPTQDRPHLLAVVVRYAMQIEHSHFEVIVSDNSTSDELHQQNLEILQDYVGMPNFRIIRPPKVLPLPWHFEFALDKASGEYISYLTDKMIILPSTLSKVEAAIQATNAEIVNWAYAPFAVDDIHSPSGSGLLTEEVCFLKGRPLIFDAIKALEFKASGKTPRNQQQTYDYALGKIVFGCYSRNLINRILEKSGTLFGGATHDYSAMIQALSMAKACVMLNTYGVLFISLPRDKSLGSLTATDSQSALRYFQSFSDGESIIANLPVPGLYSSQHNMVAYDYKKFLPMYGKIGLFNQRNWLSSISADLYFEGRVWSDLEERENQYKLFSNYLKKTNQTVSHSEPQQSAPKPGYLIRILKRLTRLIRITPPEEPTQITSRQTMVQSLAAAVQHLQNSTSEKTRDEGGVA
ncbi:MULTISPECIES: glycosyltransferase [Oxalobacteraceae]|uniref:glycosyltransferase family 2 protein n=1 Tax=Herminiimonas sp. Marseille-P9896 TaxID=2742211 RepID=UPI00158BA6BC|nr:MULTISPECIES: glycosyltransferase [Oxalobacteraceae]